MSSYNNKYVIRSLDVWALRARKNSIYVCMYENAIKCKENSKEKHKTMRIGKRKRKNEKKVLKC